MLAQGKCGRAVLRRTTFAAELGISQPQLTDALDNRFELSPETAARLLVWLRKAA
jgi:hypothetical protein